MMIAMHLFATATTLAPTFRWLWFAWGGLFVVIEAAALIMRRWYPDSNREGGTLSELFWRNVRTYDNHRHTVMFVVVATLWALLTFHFFFQ